MNVQQGQQLLQALAKLKLQEDQIAGLRERIEVLEKQQRQSKTLSLPK